MSTVKLTAKRQATLPKDLCEDMDIRPGDTLIVVPQVVDGERVWIIRPAGKAQTGWLGALKKYGKGKKHDMASIRRSIELARRNGEV